MTNIGPGLGALGEVQIMILMGEAESNSSGHFLLLQMFLHMPFWIALSDKSNKRKHGMVFPVSNVVLMSKCSVQNDITRKILDSLRLYSDLWWLLR